MTHTHIIVDLDTGIPCIVHNASQAEIQRLVDSEYYTVILCETALVGPKLKVLNESNEDPMPEGRIQPDGSLVVTDMG